MESLSEDFEGREEIIETTKLRSLMGRWATFGDVERRVHRSDWAHTLTATHLNITCGTEVD